MSRSSIPRWDTAPGGDRIKRAQEAMQYDAAMLRAHGQHWSCDECGEVHWDDSWEETKRSPKCLTVCVDCADELWPDEPSDG